MARIFIDGQPYEVESSRNLLEVSLSLGFNLPYFCWHPAMGSVGACRQCAVKQFRDEEDTRGRLVMACMTPAAEGTRISIDDPEAKAFRASVIEWLMTNHPHDCPVCDEGGECHLQDMTVMTGHTYRRYRFKKLSYRNQYLGPFIKHDMNRCIECYRCVRFYRDYAGGRDFGVFGMHNGLYFGRQEDGVLENEFSGNLIDVCPVGVFNDNTFLRHYTRKWDLQTAPSICVHCSLGCNTTPGERYNILRRIANRFNSQINGYFLCDRGRFGYEFVNQESRIRLPLLRPVRDQSPRPGERDTTLETVAARLAGTSRVFGIGSPRASLEANFALRTLVGPEHFYQGVPEQEVRLLDLIVRILKTGPVPVASIHEVEQADAVLVLGEDLLNTAPRLALALLQSIRQQPMAQISDRRGIPRWHDAAVRDAIQNQKGPLFLAGYRRTWLHDFATASYPAVPDDVARLGFAVAHAIDPQAPAVPDLDEEAGALAHRIADALRNAERPLIVSGTGSLSEAVVQAAAQVAWALHRAGRPAKLCYGLPECNSMGLALIGGRSLEEAFRAARDSGRYGVIVLENDLYRRADRALVDAFLREAETVIVLDHSESQTTAMADAIFPAATFAEGDGTLVNNEGRAQRFYQVFTPAERFEPVELPQAEQRGPTSFFRIVTPTGSVQESWRWLRDLATALKGSLGAGESRASMRAWRGLDDVVAALSDAVPDLHEVRHVTPPASLRFHGMKVPRQPKAYSGRTAMHAHLTVHEPTPPPDPDSPLAFSMEGYRGPVPGPLIPHFWSPSWNSLEALNKFQSEVGGPLREETPGVRLLTPSPANGIRYFSEIPGRFLPRPDRWLLLPLSHIFGSEELSVRAPAIAERQPHPYLALNPEDAGRAQLSGGREALLKVNGQSYRLPIVLDSSLPHGVAGLPVLSALKGVRLPAWAEIARGETP